MTVTVKTADNISQATQRLFERAKAAMNQKNYAYACDILRNILLAEPGFEDARLTLRQAQLERIGFSSSAVHQIMAMVQTAWPVHIAGPMALRKGDYTKALDTAEKAMEVDPTVVPTLKFLSRSAEEAGLMQIAINAMEVASRFHPKNRPVLQRLAQLYKGADEPTKYMNVLQRLSGMMPGNLDLQSELKHATALVAMKEARWEEAGSFRDLVKDKELAQTLEQEERIVAHDEETRLRLINVALASIEEKPTPSLYKKLASLYHQNSDYDKSIEAYRQVEKLTGNIDPAIEAAITEVMRDKFDADISELNRQLAAEPANAAAIEEQIANLESERDNVLLKRLRQRVENYPNDMQFRFELGMMLFRCGQTDVALREFQQAQRSPHLAKKAQLYMAKCLAAKNLLDLAVEQYQQTLEDTERISAADRKEALYDLSLVLEKKGDAEAALAILKELFGLDVNYRDVAERLERHYGSK